MHVDKQVRRCQRVTALCALLLLNTQQTLLHLTNDNAVSFHFLPAYSVDTAIPPIVHTSNTQTACTEYQLNKLKNNRVNLY